MHLFKTVGVFFGGGGGGSGGRGGGTAVVREGFLSERYIFSILHSFCQYYDSKKNSCSPEVKISSLRKFRHTQKRYLLDFQLNFF